MHSRDASLASNPTLTDITAALKLIRASLLMLLFMTTAFSGAMWNAMQNVPAALKPIEAVPVVLFSVVCFIVVRTYVSADEIAKVCACSVRNQEPAPAEPEN
jgi:hypothetical protein